MRHLREGPKAKYSPPPSLEERGRPGKISFEQIVSQVRSDLDHTRRLLGLLRDKVDSEAGIDEETHRWIYDTFLDKLYETNAKIKRSVVQLGLTSQKKWKRPGLVGALVKRILRRPGRRSLREKMTTLLGHFAIPYTKSDPNFIRIRHSLVHTGRFPRSVNSVQAYDELIQFLDRIVLRLVRS